MTYDQTILNQNALNAILIGKIEPLKVDGNFGEKTKNAETLFLRYLGNIFLKKQYKPCLEGLHAVRMDDNYTNVFSDWFFCFDLAENKQIKFFPASTKPGTTAVWKNAFAWIMGKQGVACLKESQILNFWSIQGAWWSGLPFLNQKAECTIYRDNNTDSVILRTVEHTGQFGINGHSWAGWRGLVVSYWKDAIRKIGVALSEGCQVTPQQFWDVLFPTIQKNNPNGLVDYTLVHLKDFE